MVAQQGVSKRVGDGLDEFDVQAEKVGVVALFDKDILATVAPVVDVIVLAVLEWDQVVHGSALPFRPGRFIQTCQVSKTWQVFRSLRITYHNPSIG